MFANLRLKGKLSLGFGLMLFLILGISVVTFVVTGGVANKAIDTKDQSVKLANIANQMKVDVIQVQQWLTDISATRGQDGLDDGFSEAESSRQSFLAGLRQSREIYRRENNSQSLQKLEGIEKAFDAYYETGKTMAQAYIDGGPAEGNKLMARFDDAAEALTNVLTPFIEQQTSKLDNNMEAIVASSGQLRSVVLIFGIIAISTGILAAWLVTRSVTDPIQRITAMIEDIAQGEGDLTKRIEVQTKDEIAELAGWFNTFVEKLHDM